MGRSTVIFGIFGILGELVDLDESAGLMLIFKLDRYVVIDLKYPKCRITAAESI